MQEKKLSIAELAQEVNTVLEGQGSNDARYSSTVSVRRIQDYQTKGLLDKPYGRGPNKWYGQMHVDKLLAIRQLQSDGLSDQSLKKISSDSPSITSSVSPDNALQGSAMQYLSQLHASPELAQSSLVKSATAQAFTNYYSATDDSRLQALNTMKKQVSKSWNEYQLDDEGKVFLRVESSVKNGEEILNQVKSIIQGDKK